MVKINIREFSHNMRKYLISVKKGERVVLMERNKPIADIIPHNENIKPAGWKRDIKRIRLKGKKCISDIVVGMRREEP